MGGALEIARACDYRVATPDAVMGLPEIKLGLLPGAGGTQRLPRIAGLEAATQMILSGDPIKGEFSLSCGLVDALFENDQDFARMFWVSPPVSAMRAIRNAVARI